MKINFDHIFKNLDGTVIGGDKPLTLRTVACSGLLNIPQGKNPKPEDKVKRYSLAIHIDGGKDELTTEEAVLLKSSITDFYISPLIVGQAFEVIEDGNSSKTG